MRRCRLCRWDTAETTRPGQESLPAEHILQHISNRTKFYHKIFRRENKDGSEFKVRTGIQATKLKCLQRQLHRGMSSGSSLRGVLAQEAAAEMRSSASSSSHGNGMSRDRLNSQASHHLDGKTVGLSTQIMAAV